MATVPVQLTTTVTDNFSGRLARAAEVAREFHLSWALREATWEPHDWGSF